MQFVRCEKMANVILSGDDLFVLVSALNDYHEKIIKSLQEKSVNVDGVFQKCAISKNLANRFQEFLETGSM